MEDNGKDILRIDNQNQENTGNIRNDSSFIDSFFLPGGILDPEEVNNTITDYNSQYILPNSGEIRYLSNNGKTTDQSDIRYAVTFNKNNYFSESSLLNHCRSNCFEKKYGFTEDKEINNVDDPVDQNPKTSSSEISHFDEWHPSRTNECSYSNYNDSQNLLPLMNPVKNVEYISGQNSFKKISPSRRDISSVYSHHIQKEESFLGFTNMEIIKDSSSNVSGDFQTEKQKETISSIVSGLKCCSKFYNSIDTHAAYCSGNIISETSHKDSSVSYALRNETHKDIRINADFLTTSTRANDFVVCKSSDNINYSNNISGTESELVSIEGTEINLNRDSTRICGTQHNFQHRLNEIDDKKISSLFHPWRNISGRIHNVSGHVTSSLSYSGTMHNQTASPINPKYSSRNHFTLPKIKSTVTVDFHNRNSAKSRQQSSLTSTTVIVDDSASSMHRPPPGFHVGHFTKTTSSNTLTFADAVSGSHLRNHDKKYRIEQRQKQERDTCRHFDNESKYNNLQNMNRRINQHQYNQQRKQLNYCQQQNQISNFQMNDHNCVNNHNSNYDGDSINSKSSRDVPSTIYLHNKFEGEEEDILTACAEDSITVLSSPVIPLLYPPVTNTSNCNNKFLSKLSRCNGKDNIITRNDVNVDRNEDKFLDHITSTMRKTGYDGDINHPKFTTLDDIAQVEKRYKFKRQKKKRNRKHIYEMPVSSVTGLYCRIGTGEDIQSHDGYSHFSQPLPDSSQSRSECNKQDKESSHLNWERRERNSRMMTIKDVTSASLIGASSIPEATPTSSSTTPPHIQQQSYEINGFFSGYLENNSKSVSNVIRLSQSILEVGLRKVLEWCLIFAYIFMSLGNNNKVYSELKQKNLLFLIWTLLHKIQLIFLNVSLFIAFVTCEIWKVLSNFTLRILPKKKRFWFLLPLFCIFVDFFFLIISALLQIFGKFIYMILLLHKLAILEVLEIDSAIICYIITCSYPELMTITTRILPMLPYGTTLVGWYAVLHWLFRPIDMKNTYIYRIKLKEKETVKVDIQTEVSKVGRDKPNTSSEVNQVTLMEGTKQVVMQESERVQMSNQILSIFRRTIPVLLLIEGVTWSQGFIMTLSRLERVLLGYGCAVIRLGYIFTPLVWLCWSIQLSVILCCEPNILIGHFLFVLGLCSIRLTHYTASVEDEEE